MTSLWARAISGIDTKNKTIFNSNHSDRSQILQDVLATLEQQRDRSQRGRWKARGINGEEIVVRDVCAKIALYVKKFVEVVDVAVGFDPLHAALPWAGIRFLLQARNKC